MASRNASKSWRTGVLGLILVLLLATALRFYRLDTQSFWNDEGNTARLVERPVRLIIEGAAGDIHPPGYYLLLHAWRAVAGESEFALRSFSAFCGILTVAVTAAIGRRTGGWLTALAAALFVAIHPLSVYYSQEARMYALLGLASVLTLWAAVRIANCELRVADYESRAAMRKHASHVSRITQHVGNRRLHRFMHHVSRITFYALSVALGLYTQYAYIFVLVGINAAFGVYWLTLRPRRWRLLWTWIAAHALGGLLFAPWAPIALGASGWRPPDLDAGQAFQALARTLLVGITLPEGAGGYALIVAGALLLLAPLTRARASTRFVKWAALGAALVPPALILALGIYRPAYLKFLMASVAPLGVVLAAGIGSMGVWECGRSGLGSKVRRWGAAVLLLALLPAQVASLHHLYANPAYARDDYRGIAARIAAEGRPGDAILLSAPNQWEVFTYYYRGPLPVHPAPYRPTPAEAAAWIDEIVGDGNVAQHGRLFVLFWGDTESDPERLLEPYLAQHAHKATDEWVTSIRLARYGTSSLPETPATTLDTRLGEVIALEGYALPERDYVPGDVIPLTLFWRAAQTPEQRYKVFVHLIDVAGALVAQADSEPGGGFAPTMGWVPGEQVVDRNGVYLPTGLPAGAYTLRVGMYSFSGERLAIAQDGQAAGDALPLAEVRVVSGE